MVDQNHNSDKIVNATDLKIGDQIVVTKSDGSKGYVVIKKLSVEKQFNRVWIGFNTLTNPDVPVASMVVTAQDTFFVRQ